MKNRILLPFLAAITLSPTLASGQSSDDARLLRFPATNSSEVAFSYAGDLYRVPITGGQAEKLTSSPGLEIFAQYSPDGKTIAFTGQYDGNTEVYTIPSSGGEPLRLTYTATNKRDDLGDRMGPNNIVVAWTPDGKEIMYRNRISNGFSGKLELVSRDGGLSTELPLPEGGFASYSPDGKKLAYNRVMREFRTWKEYKGGMADDVWVYDPAAQSVTNITENVAQDIHPMWIGDNIYYISDRDGVMNLFAYNTTSKSTTKVTNFTEYDIKFPTSHGNIIVFENGGYIYKFDVANQKPEKINITLKSDNIYARKDYKDGANYITSASASPNGDMVAVTTRGELFNIPAQEGVSRYIVRTPGSNDRRGTYSPNGEYIAYIGDGTGENEIYLYNVKSGESRGLSKSNKSYITSIQWSPDSKTIVLTDRKNNIRKIDVASGKESHLAHFEMGGAWGVSFSPDSRWISYSRSSATDYSIVYIYDLVEGKEYPVTDKWYSSSQPTFSADGKYLIFASERDFNPIYGYLEWNHVYTRMGGVYLALLANTTPSPLLEQDPSIEPAKKDTTANKVTKIDPINFSERIVKLPLSAGNYGNFYGDNDKIYYHNAGSTYMYDLKKREQSEIAKGAYMSVTTGSKKALFSKGKQLFVTDIPSSKISLDKAINLSNMKVEVDYKKEWAQIFDEAWRAFRDGFYLENMHGHDWAKIRKKYEQQLPYVASRLDLNYLIGEMIAELGVGHSYVNPGEYEGKAKRIPQGLLGAEISRDKSGYFRLDKILKGASWSSKLRSPLTEAGVDVNEGDYIIAIDGRDLSNVKDLYSTLVGKANVPTELTINSSPKSEGAHKVVIKPLDEEYSLYHYNWIQRNIALVDSLTNGRVGYIYIPDMGPEGLNQFSRYFYPQLDKEALIIDDRANGGGNVSPMILERLSREPYRLTMSRHSTKIGTVPDATLVGPMVCLVNKYSASDGDLFPWGFKRLGLGKLIGTRTWGGIIGISGPLQYMDGTDIRVPFFTSYDAKSGQWMVENHGVDPDIVIDNDPIREARGEDQQLERAIEEILKELKTAKTIKDLPAVPAPRNWAR